MSHPARRQLILEAASRLFGHYGPAKTTIGDIAAEAGIGVGSVYLEFASKDEIVSELAHARHHRVIVGMRNAAKRGDHATRLSAALEARIKVMFELAAEGAHACDLMACKGSDKGTTHRAGSNSPGRFAQEERDLLESLLRAGIEDGVFDDDDPGELLAIIERAYATLSPPWLFCQSADEAIRLSCRLSEVLIFGLKTRAESRRSPRRKRARVT